MVKMNTEKSSFGKPFLSKRFVVIAIVLCSMFLVALPAIAAEDDFVLGIYGNANEDDTIDMRDLTYVKLIFFGEKSETEFADAKYDGEINPLDFVQIKLVIVGKEEELTYADIFGDVVTVHKPVKRIISGHSCTFQVLRALDAADRIVGLDTWTHEMGEAFLQDFADLPSIGSGSLADSADYEAILALHPDVFVSNAFTDADVTPPFKSGNEKLPGVTVICLVCTHLPLSDFGNSVRTLGYILDKEKEAEEFIEWHTGYIDKIKERTAGLSEDEKQRIYFERRREYTCSCQFDTFFDLAGGRNIGADLCNAIGHQSFSCMVDPEWVIEQNPDVIIRTGTGGYSTDDPSRMIDRRNEILNRPELVNVAAVKEGRVYIAHYYGVGSFPDYIIFTAYMAKWFHPELFEDLDPQAIHQEYVNRFQGIDFDVSEHGVFVYPPLE